MSRFKSASSYDHRISKFSSWGGFYRISWVVDFHYSGSRQRHPRRFTRDVDEDGAKRFCKKWDIALPKD